MLLFVIIIQLKDDYFSQTLSYDMKDNQLSSENQTEIMNDIVKEKGTM